MAQGADKAIEPGQWHPAVGPREAGEQGPSQTAGYLQLDPSALRAPVAEVRGAPAGEPRVLPHGETGLLQRRGQGFSEPGVQPSHEDHRGPFPAAVDGDHGGRPGGRAHAPGFVEKGAGDVELQVVVGLQPLEAVEGMLAPGHGLRDLGGPGLDLPAVRGHEGDPRQPRPNPNPIVQAFPLGTPELRVGSVFPSHGRGSASLRPGLSPGDREKRPA